MATCMELGSLIPEESDYEVVKDTSVREVIRFIFDGTHITIKKVGLRVKLRVGLRLGLRVGLELLL